MASVYESDKGMRKRICIYILGYLILSFGQRLFVLAHLGAASLDAVCVGLEKNTGLSAGTWVYITAVIMIAVSAVLRRSKPNYFAMLSSFVFGIFFDMWGLVFQWIELEGHLFTQIGIYVIAVILAPLGTSIYFLSEFPKSAIDDFVLSVSETFSFSIGVSKTICEALFCILAGCFSGPVGITTIITALLFGPLLQFFYLRIHKQYDAAIVPSWGLVKRVFYIRRNNHEI